MLAARNGEAKGLKLAERLLPSLALAPDAPGGLCAGWIRRVRRAHALGWDLSPLERRLAFYRSGRPWFGNLPDYGVTGWRLDHGPARVALRPGVRPQVVCSTAKRASASSPLL